MIELTENALKRLTDYFTGKGLKTIRVYGQFA
jgi:hypothetical protein